MSDDANVTAASGEATQERPSTPAVDPQAIAQIVKAQVEQQMSERLANLDSEVERRVQSNLAKRENKAKKQFGVDKEAIDRMAQRKGWSQEQTAQELKEAWEIAHITADAEPEPEPAPTNQPSKNPPSDYPPLQDPKRELESFVKTTYGLDASEFDVSPYATITDANDPRVAQFRQAVLQKALDKERDQAARKQNADSVADTKKRFNNLGTQTSGNAPPPRNPISDIEDPDELWRIAQQQS